MKKNETELTEQEVNQLFGEDAVYICIRRRFQLPLEIQEHVSETDKDLCVAYTVSGHVVCVADADQIETVRQGVYNAGQVIHPVH